MSSQIVLEMFSVKEKMPETDKRVLAYSADYDDFCIAKVIHLHNRLTWMDVDGDFLYEVKHWCELPKL